MKKLLLALTVAVMTAVGAGAYVVYARVDEPFRGYSGDAQELDIPSGATPTVIGNQLVSSGIVRDVITFRVALWLSGDARRLKAGTYRFDRPMSARDVLGKIARGEVAFVMVTFREGLTIEEMAAVYEKQGLGAADAFRDAAADVSLIAALDPDATDLEGYLFPDTYPVTRHAQASQLVRAMVGRFTQVLTPELRSAASERGLTTRQLVTLASIVEKETGSAEERPIVAAVYANRLKIGMGLQCDPTVIYALQRVGKYNGNLRRDDLAFDSPYNTYRYTGLPPGPIAAPGQGALAAAASPAAVDFLYFVSRNDGTHAFSRSLDEHNRNVQKFQVQFFRDRRAAERRAAARGTVAP